MASTSVDLVRVASKFGQTCALLFVIWQSGDGFKKFGIVKDRVGRVVGLAAVLLVADMIIGMLVTHRTTPALPTLASFERRGLGNSLVVVLGTTMNSTFEELLFRSYLFTRLEELFGDKALALVATFVGFGCLHIYEGMRGFINASVIGLCLGIAFIRFRSVIPLALAHTLGNLCKFFAY